MNLTVTANGVPVATVAARSAVTLTATVFSGNTPVWPGQVKFCDATVSSCTGTRLLATSQLTFNGTATYKFVPGPGIHTYKAIFVGTNAFAGNASSIQTLAVTALTGPLSTTVGVLASGGQGNYALLGTVATNGVVPPTGQVTFLDTSNANYVLGTAQLGPTGASGITFRNSYTFNQPGPGLCNCSTVDFLVGDFNGDGIPDLLVSDVPTSTIYLLTGIGDGTFRSSSIVTFSNAFQMLIFAVGDFNSDGKLDFIVSTSATQITTFLGNGDGTFTKGPTSNPIGQAIDGFSPIVEDFNGDGIPDLLLVTQGNSTDYLQVSVGNGDGSFTPLSNRTTIPPIPGLAYGVVVSDFNNDRKPDVAFAAPYPQRNVQVFLGNGDGTFTASPSVVNNVSTASLTASDLNGDGNIDLVVTNSDGVPAAVLLGRGDGTFTQLPPDPNLAQGPAAVITGDFNGDGISDLVFPDNDGGYTSVFLGKGDGTFTPDAYSPSVADSLFYSLGIADFNGDGQSDIVEAFGYGFYDPSGPQTDVAVLLSQGANTTAGYAYNISPVGTGYHYIVGAYPGDANNAGGTSSPVPLLAQQVSTALSINVTPVSGSAASQPVTVTATLNQFFAQNHYASGSVTFYNGARSLGKVAVTNGVASLTTSALPAGTDQLSAYYPGDTNFTDSTSNTLPYLVVQNPVAPTITFSVPNHTYGDPPFTVSASSNSGGTITYSVVSGPAFISGNVVTLTGAGTVVLLASQAANGIYSAGTQTASFTVTKESQTITFVPPSSPVNYGSAPVALNATASSGLAVTFSILSGPATVAGSVVTYTNTGTVVIAANQSGNANFSPATQVTASVTVIGRAAAISFTGTPNPVFLQNPLTLSAILSGAVGAPTGTVQVMEGSSLLGASSIIGGNASLVLSNLTLGVHVLTAIYSGDAVYASLSSAPLTVTVEDYGLSVSNPNQIIFHGGAATYLLTVNSVGGLGTASDINFSVTGGPDHSSISFSPSSVPKNSGPTNVTLVIQTPNYPVGPWNAGLSAQKSTVVLSFLALGMVGLRARARKARSRLSFGGLLLILLCISSVSFSGCGWGWATQHYYLTITASSGQVSRSVAATLTTECTRGRSVCPVE